VASLQQLSFLLDLVDLWLILLPRDAMRSADNAAAQDVCLTVRPSHAGIPSKRLIIITKLFSPSGSHTILVFPF